MLDHDLGEDVSYTYFAWKSNRDDLMDVRHIGMIIEHQAPDTLDGICLSAIMFDCETSRIVFPRRPKWKIKRWDPLTLEPSIQCRCGFYGYIEEGKWVSRNAPNGSTETLLHLQGDAETH